MRRILCVVLMTIGFFAIYVLAIGVNMLCGSIVVILLALIVALFMTREPFSQPDPAELPDQIYALSAETEA